MMTHRVVNGEVYKKTVVHRFKLSDVDDPEIYAAQPIWEWQQSEPGKFVMENAMTEPELHKNMDYTSYGYQFAITAWLKEKDLTYFYLRWS